LPIIQQPPHRFCFLLLFVRVQRVDVFAEQFFQILLVLFADGFDADFGAFG
jgi:hypothetical protein